MIQLFGFPVFKKSLSDKEYDRVGLIKTISDNYNLDNDRNVWDKDYSYIHHCADDMNNNLFKEPDYSTVLPLYEEAIQEFLKQLNFKNYVKYKWSIVNYTCMANGQYMREHSHTNADFTSVHYLQYDDKTNNSTTYHNTSHHSKYIDSIRPRFKDNFDSFDTKNSWMFETFKLPTRQDDLVIFPAMFYHSISRVNTNKKRMTIIFNFEVNNYE
tara:strand:- start:38 stop:676 length:639 start_codon:yes stop_codon:yes gene_type:complete